MTIPKTSLAKDVGKGVVDAGSRKQESAATCGQSGSVRNHQLTSQSALVP